MLVGTRLEFFFNELSIHGQLGDPPVFQAAVSTIMSIRNELKPYGKSLHCSRLVHGLQCGHEKNLSQMVATLPFNKRRAFMSWLTSDGPFWNDEQIHSEDDWLEHRGDVITETTLGEAAWCCFVGRNSSMVSMSPSDWEYDPIEVLHCETEDVRHTTQVSNYWSLKTVSDYLESQPNLSINSWKTLEEFSRAKHVELTFSEDCFKEMFKQPYSESASKRIQFLLQKLNELKNCFDEDGNRTGEGHELYQNFFTGQKGDGGRGAMFSDSSDDEKRNYEQALTFEHPDKPGETITAAWHGKVQTPQLRVHFSWPVTKADPLYVVYIGPKLTV